MSCNNCHAKKSHYGSKCNDYDCKGCKSCAPEFRDDDCCCAQIVAAYINATATVNAALQDATARQGAVVAVFANNANLAITNALEAANQYLCKKCKLKLNAPTPYSTSA